MVKGSDIEIKNKKESLRTRVEIKGYIEAEGT